MNNAHLRFGWLTYYKQTEKATTHFKLRLDRFIGEVLPDDPRRAKAHLISVVGGDTQIAAANAAMLTGESFEIEGPGVMPIRVSLNRNAQTNRGSLQLQGQKRPLRHLVGLSEEIVNNNGSTSRVILAQSEPSFVWMSLAQIHGIPAVPEWADWFYAQLEHRKAIVPLLGIGCAPVIVRGTNKRFLAWLGHGVKRGHLAFPSRNKRIDWPSIDLEKIFTDSPASKYPLQTGDIP
jgi:hypothetical protein